MPQVHVVCMACGEGSPLWDPWGMAFIHHSSWPSSVGVGEGLLGVFTLVPLVVMGHPGVSIFAHNSWRRLNPGELLG